MKKVVIDDKMIYISRIPSLVANEVGAEMEVITRRIIVVETTSDADTDNQRFKCKLYEPKVMGGKVWNGLKFQKGRSIQTNNRKKTHWSQ